MTEAAYAHELLQALRSEGVRISIDDFGTGYSSLAQLHRFNFDTLKIDRLFVEEMLDEEYVDLLVQTILLLAGSMEIDVIAEGIEHSDAAERLQQLGCRLGQGYLFGRPTAKTDATAMLLNQMQLGRPTVGAEAPLAIPTAGMLRIAEPGRSPEQ